MSIHKCNKDLMVVDGFVISSKYHTLGASWYIIIRNYFDYMYKQSATISTRVVLNQKREWNSGELKLLLITVHSRMLYEKTMV